MSSEHPTPTPARDAAGVVPPKTYRSTRDLSAGQLVSLRDLWKTAESMVKGMEMPESTITEFEKAIFVDGWDSTDDSLMEPKIADRKFLHTSIVAGRFTEDLPNKGKPQELAARKAGQPAYLKVHVGGPAESLGWLWTDAQGRMANKAYIGMAQDEGELMRKVVLRYDKAEKQRVLPYNAEVAVFIARHRILAWSTAGFPSRAVGEDNRFELFKPLVLPSRLLQEHRRIAELMDVGVTSSQVDATSVMYQPLA
ncbi:hypothetical protein DL768_000771 [Monosporascus sp. mg162]|nr:hypothetical protein DL768_000771 [Monosporascus sp. mg162]